MLKMRLLDNLLHKLITVICYIQSCFSHRKEYGKDCWESKRLKCRKQYICYIPLWPAVSLNPYQMTKEDALRPLQTNEL